MFVWVLASLYLLDSVTCLIFCPIDEAEARDWAIWKFNLAAAVEPTYDPTKFEGPRLTRISSPFGVSSSCPERSWGETLTEVLLSFLLSKSEPLSCGAHTDPAMYLFEWEYRGRPAMGVWVDRCGEHVEWFGPSQELYRDIFPTEPHARTE